MEADRDPMSGKISQFDNQLKKIFNEMRKHEGEIVSREQLIDRIWLGNTYVGRSALTKNMWRLRKALKADKTLSHYYIETIPKQGYRLVSQEDQSIKTLFLRSTKISNLVLTFFGIVFILMVMYASTTENKDYILVPSDDVKNLPVDLQEFKKVTGESNDPPLLRKNPTQIGS